MKNIQSSLNVDVISCYRVCDRPRNTGKRSLMEDNLHSLHGIPDDMITAHIAFNNINIISNIDKIGPVPGREIVKNSNCLTPQQGFPCNIAPDETSASSNKIHLFSSPQYSQCSGGSSETIINIQNAYPGTAGIKH